MPAVFSHEGALWEALLVAAWRGGTGDKAADVSLGFSGEPVGVKGRAVDGEPCLMEPGRPNGDWRDPRALLKKRGDGFESVGADCSTLVVQRRGREARMHTMMLCLWWLHRRRMLTMLDWAVMQRV